MDRDKDGNLIIIDYKSGKAPAAKYKEPRFFAMKLYALLIKEELGEEANEIFDYFPDSPIASASLGQF